MNTSIFHEPEKSHEVKFIRVLTPSGYKLISHIHECERDFLWKTELNDGRVLMSSPAHHIHGEGSARVDADDFSPGMSMDTVDGLAKVENCGYDDLDIMVSQIDITVIDKPHLYYADGVTVHNCVSPFTEVQVKNVTRGQRMRLPIFRILYSQLPSKGWRDVVGNFFLEVAYLFHRLSLPSSSHNGTQAT